MTVQSLTQIAAETHRRDLHRAAERRRPSMARRAERRPRARLLELRRARQLRVRPA